MKYEGELPTTRKVYCIEEDKIYDSVVELAKEWNCGHSNIYACCNKKRGYKSIKGKHLIWLDEFVGTKIN